MNKLRVRHIRVSKKGTTLVELIVSLTLMAIFALACTALIVPIERSYRQTVMLTRAQLLADTLVDSIRKECDDVKHDEAASVWIANFNESSADDASLLSQGPGIKASAGKGNALIFQRNNNYTEAIYACLPISADNFTNVADNPLTDPDTAHAINALENAGGENLKRGVVHFGFYQAKEDDRGVFPIQSYDYTNPVMVSTYGEFTVKLEFSNLVLQDEKYPAFVDCKVSVYVGDCNSDKNKVSGPFYSRTTVICFSANGSASGSGGSHSHSTDEKDVSITVKWKDSQGAAIAWPTDVASINVQLAESDGKKKTHTLQRGQSRFVFANVKVKGKITVTSSELDDYDCTVTGNAVSGFVITYQSAASDVVKLVSGPTFNALIPTSPIANTRVIFGKASDYPSIVKNYKGTNVSVNIKAKNDDKRTDDYKLYSVPNNRIVTTLYTVYVLSADGRFVANENCEGMFKEVFLLDNLTGMDNVDTYLTTNMKDMFKNCRAMKQFNVPNLIKGRCQTTESMFEDCYSATYFNFSSCDSSGVKNMNRMFCDIKATEVNLTGLEFDSVTSADNMFLNDNKLTKITSDGKSTDSASGTFTLNMPQCKSASSMFNNCSSLTTFNGKLLLPSCTNFSSAFNSCDDLQSVNLSKSNFNKCNNFSGIFSGCSDLTKIRMDEVDLDSATSLNFMSLSSIRELYMSRAKLKSLSSLQGWYRNKNIQKIVFSEVNLNACLSTKSMFSGCTNLKSIDMNNFKTPVCTDMSSMFSRCLSVTSIDVSKWDTHSVQNMSYMFKMVNGYVTGEGGTRDPLAVLDVSDFDFSACTTLLEMFSGEYASSRNLKKVIVSTESKAKSAPNVTTAQQMFYYNFGMQEVVMDNFSIPACTTVQNMFTNCSGLKIVNISNFNTSGCTNYSDMFSSTPAVEEMHLPGWQTGSGLTSLAQYWLFRGGRPNVLSSYNRDNLKYVDISYWDTTYLNSIENAFESAPALLEVKMVGMNVPNLTAGRYCFQNATKLQKVDMTDSDLSKVSAVSFFQNTKALTTVTCTTGKSPNWTGGNSFKGSKISERDVIYV